MSYLLFRETTDRIVSTVSRDSCSNFHTYGTSIYKTNIKTSPSRAPFLFKDPAPMKFSYKTGARVVGTARKLMEVQTRKNGTESTARVRVLWNKRNEKKVRIIVRKRKHRGTISGGSETCPVVRKKLGKSAQLIFSANHENLM